MMENEDSVVTSLNELRKLKNERITRQSQVRSTARARRMVFPADDPAADQLTPGPEQAQAILGAGRAAEARASSANMAAIAQASQPFAFAPMPAPAVIRTKTSYTAAALVAVALLGAGGAGYVKLQNDTQAQLAAKEVALKQAEDARNRALDQATKTEVAARTNLRQCEDKLKAAALTVAPVAAPAAAAVVASVPAAASTPVAKKPEKVAAKGKVAVSKAASQPVRHTAKAETAAPKSGEVPLIAKKKKLANDPLDGLGKQ
jgi:hypothetical protein